MKAKLYDPKDYPSILPWWEMRGLRPIPIEMLPSMGVIAEDDKGMAAAAWVYRDHDGKLAWLAWSVTNPVNTAMRSTRAVRVIAEAAEALCQEFGFRILVAETDSKGLVKTLVRCGFYPNVVSTQLWKGIPHGT